MVLAPHPSPDSPVLTHFSLAGKTAFVTGGSRGIGLEIARGLVEAGVAGLAITYSSTSADEAAATASSLAALSPSGSCKVEALQVDVRSRTAVDAAVESAPKLLGTGKLDILVANAGIAGHIPASEYPEDAWRDMFDVNVHGAFWAARAAAKVFERQWRASGGDGEGEGTSGPPHRGSIVFTASVSGTLVNVPQKQSAYNASKAGLIHLAKSLSVEWVDFARVNCVSPGFIDTDMLTVHPEEWRKKWFSMIPARRLCKASELKGAYVFLASDASSYMTGADMIIDGGYTLP